MKMKCVLEKESLNSLRMIGNLEFYKNTKIKIMGYLKMTKMRQPIICVKRGVEYS